MLSRLVHTLFIIHITFVNLVTRIIITLIEILNTLKKINLLTISISEVNLLVPNINKKIWKVWSVYYISQIFFISIKPNNLMRNLLLSLLYISTKTFIIMLSTINFQLANCQNYYMLQIIWRFRLPPNSK